MVDARWLPAVLAWLVSAAGCGARPAERPNVLLVTLDTTRADFLGCYGRAGNPTPCLDAIAADGARFDRAIATASLTPVSHASILTGLDNARHGVRVLAAGGGMKLPPGIPTLSTLLRERGYRTGAVLSAFPVSSAYGFDRGFDHFDCPEGALQTGPAGQPTWNLSRLQRRADATTDRAIEWAGQARAPFLLWVHYFDPHDAAVLPPAEAIPPGVALPPKGTLDLSRDLYGVEVSYVDAQLARLVAALKASGAWESTIVAVVSDHGEGLGDHGWQHHRLLYQEQIRVPLLFRAPGGPSGAVVHELVRTTDLLPTILDYARAEAPAGLDGSSLRGLLEGRGEPPRLALADAINGYDENARVIERRPLDRFLYCAMSARWKLVYRPEHPGSSELFDLSADPGEAENLFLDRSAEALELEKVLAGRRPWVTAPFPPLDARELDRSREALESLGYTGGGEMPPPPVWSFACPEHRGTPTPEPIDCPICGSPPILLR